MIKSESFSPNVRKDVCSHHFYLFNIVRGGSSQEKERKKKRKEVRKRGKKEGKREGRDREKEGRKE